MRLSSTTILLVLAGLAPSAASVQAELVATPLVPADFVDVVDPLRSGADLRARLVAVHPETRDAATLVLRPGRGWRGHVPGQYVRIGVDVDGVRQWRAYSVTSPRTRTDGCITVTVKAIPDGVVSNHLVRRAQAGAVLQLDQAAGDFVLPTPRPAKVAFVTAGSGITPVMGMLRSARLPDAVLVHSAPTRDDVVFGQPIDPVFDQRRAEHRRHRRRHTDKSPRIIHLDVVLRKARAREGARPAAKDVANRCAPTLPAQIVVLRGLSSGLS